MSCSVDYHVGERHGVRRVDPVNFRLDGTPSKTSTLLTAARLGLDLENDVRVASERLSVLRYPLVPIHRPLPIIVDPPENSTTMPDFGKDDKIMPLL